MQSEAASKSSPDRVSAALTFVGYDLCPQDLTQILGIEPSYTDATPLPARFKPGGISPARDCGLWCYDTAAHVTSKDIGEHIRHLLRLFGPLKSRIEDVLPPLNLFVHIKCQPLFSVASSRSVSPRLDRDCIAGMAQLGATVTVELIQPGARRPQP
jgi:hypothetical protein